MQQKLDSLSVAVLIPCYNEAQTITQVIEDYRKVLPHASIVVCDNRSTDNTAELAKQAGAKVCFESRPGKGCAVRRLFSDVDADVYLLVDGDNTYQAESAIPMIQQLLEQQLDMVVGARDAVDPKSYPQGHSFGNKLFNFWIRSLFGQQFTDIFSGYRVFSRRFVKSFPCLSKGFEIETEISVHALEMNLPVAELKTPYRERPPGSESKLNTFRDGFRILLVSLKLLKDVRPLLFFGAIFSFLSLFALVLFYPLLIEYWQTGLVPRLPTAVLVASLMILAFLSLFSGVVLDSVARNRLHYKRLLYLALARGH